MIKHRFKKFQLKSTPEWIGLQPHLKEFIGCTSETAHVDVLER